MNITYRSLHRDLGYFYVGLIIVFAISGLFLNHRENWHPLKYEYSSSAINIPQSLFSRPINENTVLVISNKLAINDKLSQFGTEENTVWVSYKNTELEFDKSSGIGKIRRTKTTPVLGQMTMLHIDTSKFWIYYSDIFSISLLIIAITAIVFPKGNYSFKKYGWKLSLAGIVIPILFLIYSSI